MIKDIKWDRTKLRLILSADDSSEDIYLSDGDRTVPLSIIEAEGSKEATLDICIASDGEMLESGEWEIIPLKASDLAFEKLEDASRIFKYDGDYGYTVSFSSDDEGRIILSSEFIVKNSNPRKRDVKKNILKVGVNEAYKLFRSRRNNTEKKNILFLSETRDTPSDNFRALGERMLERGMGREYEINWYLKNNVKNGATKEERLSLIKLLAEQDYIIVDDYVPTLSVLDLPSDVRLLQVWHAGFGYKLVGYARFGRTGSPHPYDSCHRKYTMAVIGNEKLKPVYSEVFGLTEEKLIPTGMPRLEEFANPEMVEGGKTEVYSKYPELKGKKVVLFAPTYRGYQQKEAYYDYSKIDQKALFDYCIRENAAIVFKFHHFLEGGFEIEDRYKERLFDLSNENLNRLMYISDVLITDYSSCFYDYILLNRPIIFYIFDEKEYELTRGVHYPVSETCPGLIARTSDELIQALDKCEEEWKKVSIPDYMKDQAITNGDYGACDRIIDRFFSRDSYGENTDKPEI